MKRIHFFLLALLSALLFSIPYFSWGTGIVLFFAFVPLLFMEEEMSRRKDAAASGKAKGKAGSKEKASHKGKAGRPNKPGRILWWVVLAFALWVLLTTYWVYFATWIGIVASVILHSAYMILVFWLFHWTKRRLGPRLGYASLVFYWLTFEFLYIRAQVNFPWILLGNGFAYDVMLIQWYEFTGVLGGTLWALVVNLALYFFIRNWGRLRAKGAGWIPTLKAEFPALRSSASWAVALFILPALFSLVRFLTYEEEDDPYEMVVLQPNIDPYMKFNDIPQAEQTAILIRLADSLSTPKTEYIIGPETAINKSIWQDQMQTHPELNKLRTFLTDYPRAKMVVGATTLRLYKDSSEFTESSRPMGRGDYRYDSYNSAMQLDASGEIPLYHKSRLVVGVEFMPFKNLLKPIQKLTIRLGGTLRSPAIQAFRGTFVSPADSTRVGPVICWESVFGEYVTDYVKESGAHFLFIITNDGWWRNTPGHRQHNAYARLRAIENRRSIARSANTGISSLINQRGQELARIGWWERSAIRAELNKNEKLTFYTRYGDYLGRMAAFVTVILLLYTLLQKYARKEA